MLPTPGDAGIGMTALRRPLPQDGHCGRMRDSDLGQISGTGTRVARAIRTEREEGEGRGEQEAPQW